MGDGGDKAPGRLVIGPPVAIVDIGSNSVRLVVYEGLTRSPTPLFNEKVLCGLGRSVASTGQLAEEAVAKALRALARFRVLCGIMKVAEIHVLATAAVRDAANGQDFLAKAEAVSGCQIKLLAGTREAELSALGVISGFHRPDGVVGDLGGGSLELVDVKGSAMGAGVSLRLGGLALQDAAGGSLKKAQKIAREALAGIDQAEAMRGRNFYAVGGTWRALATLHMSQMGYPLHVMHSYTITPRDAMDFASMVERVEAGTLDAIDNVSEARRPLLAYGALVLEEIIRRGKPKAIVISALGVREGLLYELLDDESRALDPLLTAAAEFNELRARSPAHAEELVAWMDDLFHSLHLDETADERRVRHAVCLVSDISWRAHPDYRGEQALGLLAQASFVSLDHAERAFIALANYFRHVGLSDDGNLRARELLTVRMLDRARILGAAMRVAYILSAAMPGVLPRVPLRAVQQRLTLRVPLDMADVSSDRIANRLRQLAKLVGREPSVVTGG
ncbi:exopolyphosphatase [Chelatococcus reniformis]|uniref:exopolyphosphatase n=1 Tax=Chelatococcus reniformis TaxID=1494448 RepID=A0A916UD08_9HYPH|nr:exopolyphosphatase [Chelatococcus reniformis]GGC69239.1 exopolyphosphatase [Chelatococcus reniformis]